MRKNAAGRLLIAGLVLLGFASLIGAVLLARSGNQPSPLAAAPAASTTMSPIPTPAIAPRSPSEHLAEARKLLRPPYNKSNYEDAIAHLSAIPRTAKEYRESERLKRKAIETREREEAAKDPANQLVVVKSRWEKGGFGTVVIWRVTLKNNTAYPIGDIQYRTAYYSETGNLVDKGGVDSTLGKKVVQKVIPPKATRTIEINDGFTHSEAHRASFELVSWRFVADQR